MLISQVIKQQLANKALTSYTAAFACREQREMSYEQSQLLTATKTRQKLDSVFPYLSEQHSLIRTLIAVGIGTTSSVLYMARATPPVPLNSKTVCLIAGPPSLGVKEISRVPSPGTVKSVALYYTSNMHKHLRER